MHVLDALMIPWVVALETKSFLVFLLPTIQYGHLRRYDREGVRLKGVSP